MLCRENEALFKDQFKKEDLIINLCLCQSCHDTPEALLEEAIFLLTQKRQTGNASEEDL
jgi:hypothetical protein